MQRWYVGQVHRGQETVALRNLENQLFTAFVPYLATERARHGKTYRVAEPLFPGYIFVRFALDGRWQPIASTRGMRRLLGNDNVPCPLPRGYVEALAPCCEPPGAVVRRLVPGVSQVRLRAGQFAGMQGLFQAQANERVKILLQILGRGVFVTAPIAAVEAA